MSSKKRLGSSPIGVTSDKKNTMTFIPDHGVSNTKRKANKKTGKQLSDTDDAKKESSSDKQVASYSLEKELIKRLKLVADECGMYYSTLVSKALKQWLAERK